MESAMLVEMVMFSIPFIVSSLSFVQHALPNIEYEEKFDSFHFDCIRRCQRSEYCVATHISEGECYSLDLTQYKSLVEVVYTGVLYKKMDVISCKNGGYLGNNDETQCICSQNFAGKHCERQIEDCSEGYRRGSRFDGIYTIQPRASLAPFQVYCQMAFGGRTYVQKQKEGISFIRTWNEYKTGFGDVNEDFWLGLEKIKDIALNGLSRLVIHIKTASGGKQCNYQNFTMKGESDGYKITYTKYATTSKPLGDCLNELKGSRFSSWDKDNDGWDAGSCASVHQSGWWFNNCTSCNPNGILKPSSETPDSEKVYWQEVEAVSIHMALSRK